MVVCQGSVGRADFGANCPIVRYLPRAHRKCYELKRALKFSGGSRSTLLCAAISKKIAMTKSPDDTSLSNHPIVSNDQWLRERRSLLEREKTLSRQLDVLARERRALPWVRVDKSYVFDTTEGDRTLAELFKGRRQLLVQHFMFGPDWTQGCPSCSFMADHVDGMTIHLANRDTTFVAVSRASLDQIQDYRHRMGWQFDWVSSNANDFNFDFGVSVTPDEAAARTGFYNYGSEPFEEEEQPGISVFLKDDGGEVFHTYSTYGRGVEAMMGTYRLLDLTPKGRDEESGHGMAWLRRHDSYDAS
jgi:predicted dithiol-disulfide oxidoreductase (DUF899 family)